MRATRGHQITWAGLGMMVAAWVFSGAAGFEPTAGAQGTNPLQVNVMAVVPKQVYAGSEVSIPITAVDAESKPVSIPVAVLLGSPGAALTCVAYGLTDSQGRYDARFEAPATAAATCQVQIMAGGAGEVLAGTIAVREMPVLLVETDKPIYKPGQTIHGRLLVLDHELKPAVGAPASVEISDGKGVKVFRKDLIANAFGVAPFDLDLATELNEGTWKIKAASGSASGQADVRVERYVLPRFEVHLEQDRDYFLVKEAVPGAVSARYFFGQPVDGTAVIRASRYVGQWEEYARYTAPLTDGKAAFTLPAVGYVSGTAGAGGAGSVRLNVTVTDTSEHEESTEQLLKIVDSLVQHRIVPLSRTIAPGHPLLLTLVAEDPAGEPLTVSGRLTAKYGGDTADQVIDVALFTGQTTISLDVPAGAVYLSLTSTVWSEQATDTASLQLGRSTSTYPNGFVHLSPTRAGTWTVGQTAVLEVVQPDNRTVYYDVFAQGRTLYSGATRAGTIEVPVTLQMTPAARVLAYVINPNAEVSADSLTLEVAFEPASPAAVAFDVNEALPGQAVQLSVQTEGQAMVGLAVVDESVYALSAGRLNMQQVMEELEKRFMVPRQETHYSQGVKDIFGTAGLQILASRRLSLAESVDSPAGSVPMPRSRGGGGGSGTTPAPGTATAGDELAEVTYIRQFFPETWVWLPDLMTDEAGRVSLPLAAPDSITSWRVHVVSTGPQGLGLAESSLLVFQEFFGEPDLPAAVTRGERFPVRIQIFNYLDVDQVVHVTLAEADWFKLLDVGTQQVLVPANTVGLASFEIQPLKLGTHLVEVTLRSALRADAVRKPLRVEAEGTTREEVTNGLLEAGQSTMLDVNVPAGAVPDSQQLLLSVTPSLVAQSIQGVDNLLNMPYGCGEQNMIFFAPDVEILRYLDATDQLSPEVRAKAEHFITVGYQRELTYQRQDGSFSAFGNGDSVGSLWLTAFVLGTFSGARDVQTIDEAVLDRAAQWIASHQQGDGSWKAIGFLHNTGMAGGVNGAFTLTAYALNALLDYGAADSTVRTKAVQYLGDHLMQVQDSPYALAVAAHVFARMEGDRDLYERAMDRLWDLAVSDSQGVHWTPRAVETTAYAALALLAQVDARAKPAVEWISLQRNSKGGFGQTQDTVMALKALMTAARAQTRSTAMELTVRESDGRVVANLTLDATNYDVLQTVELPLGRPLVLSATGAGKTRYQLVRRYNVLLRDGPADRDMGLSVVYDANTIEVDDLVDVHVTVQYRGPLETTGMMIVDVGVPTGFDAVRDSLDKLVEDHVVSRVEQAGRKVIFYLDGLVAGQVCQYSFQVVARWPVRAVVPDSQAYLYYDPQVRAESAGVEVMVNEEKDGEL